MIIPTILSTKTVPRSGISKKTNNRQKFNTANAMKNSGVLIMNCLRTSHPATKIIYPSLKNSDGCNVVPRPIFLKSNRPLAPLKSTPSGENTRSWKITAIIPIQMMTFFLWKKLRGSLYTIKLSHNPKNR